MLMKYRLFTPGPTSVPEATLLELAKPVHHHRTAEFRATFAEVQTLLKYVFQTSQPIHVITGSGTGAYEAGLTSVFAPGSRVLNVSNGKFAERWAQMAKSFGLDTKELKLDYGTHATPALIQAELTSAAAAGKPLDGVLIVHSETSTATICDLESIATVIRTVSPSTLLVTDGITSIGALPFKMDEWGIDVAITGSQKALMLPPGLGFVALSERAQARMHATPATGRQFYFDLRKSEKTLADGDTPFTPANTLVEGLLVSLRMIRVETIETIWKRTATTAAAFRAAMRAANLEVYSQTPADSVTAIKFPQNGTGAVNDKAFRNHLKNAHNIHVAGGQGSMEGTMFRLNHMGYTDIYDCLAAVAAIEHTLKKLGHPFEQGKPLSTAHAELSKLFT